jgi:TfoX/Sxy family transcriptional regulator of competence genes
MTVEEDVAADVRAVLAGAGDLSEVRMFGGIGFMLNGNMVAGVSKRGLLLRVGKDRYAEALAQPGVRRMEMRGRPMEGYVYFELQALTDRERSALGTWLENASDFVRTLPAKSTGARPKRKGQRK